MSDTVSESEPAWLALPHDVQAHILQLLPPADQRRARLACKIWAQLVPAWACVKSVVLAGPLADSDEDVAAALARCPGLASLTLGQEVGSAALASLALQPWLTELLCCAEASSTAYLAALAALTELRSLHAVRLPSSVLCLEGQPRPALQVSALTGLVSLRLTGRYGGFHPAGLAVATCLTALQLDLTPELDRAAADEQLAAALPVLTGLRSLQLNDEACRGPGLVLAALSALTALTCLHIITHHCCGGYLHPALEELTGLQDLKYIHRYFQPSDGLLPAVARLRALSRLELPRCEVYAPRMRLLERLPRLAELSLHGVDKFGAVTLAGLSRLTALSALALLLVEGAGELAHIVACTQLRRLELAGYGRRVLAPPRLPLPLLTKLCLPNSEDLCAWLPELATQQPHLQSLSFRVCSGPAAVAAHLAACTALSQLSLSCNDTRCCFDDMDLSCLALLPALAELQLAYGGGSPRAAALRVRGFTRYVTRSRRLRRLTLLELQLYDADCALLAGAASLECLTLRSHPVWLYTPQGHIKGAHPRRLPRNSPGLAALLSAGCRVEYEIYPITWN